MTSVTKLTAVYPGTFDPMTLGHEDLMRRASRLFERLILAVAAGHHKSTMFSVEERLDIAKELSSRYKNVEVIAFRGLLRDFVVANAGKVVVRGLECPGWELRDANQLLVQGPLIFAGVRERLGGPGRRRLRVLALLGGDAREEPACRCQWTWIKTRFGG